MLFRGWRWAFLWHLCTYIAVSQQLRRLWKWWAWCRSLWCPHIYLRDERLRQTCVVTPHRKKHTFLTKKCSSFILLSISCRCVNRGELLILWLWVFRCDELAIAGRVPTFPAERLIRGQKLKNQQRQLRWWKICQYWSQKETNNSREQPQVSRELEKIELGHLQEDQYCLSVVKTAEKVVEEDEDA